MKKVIVIGNGMVGFKFCEKLAAHPLCDQFEVLVFGEESRPAYDRVHLSEYFSLDSADKLLLASRDWYFDNNKMETSDPSIYAIGEVALYNNGIYGLVAPGYEMAGVAVDQITGTDKRMSPSIDMSTQLKLVGTEVASFGDPFVENEDITAIVYENKHRGVYKRINVSKDGSLLHGGILVGDSSDYNTLFQLYINAMKLPDNPEDLILGSRGGESKSLLGSVLDLPETAQICSCEAEMEELVQRYACEWKEAIEDPQMLKRFKPFVNSDEPDDQLEFVPMREQKMPRPW